VKEITTTNFGFAAFLVIVKGYNEYKITPKEGITVKITDDIFPKDLQIEYNSSNYKKYNNLLREIIKTFLGK
jgi:hypothetical protein